MGVFFHNKSATTLWQHECILACENASGQQAAASSGERGVSAYAAAAVSSVLRPRFSPGQLQQAVPAHQLQPRHPFVFLWQRR